MLRSKDVNSEENLHKSFLIFYFFELDSYLKKLLFERRGVGIWRVDGKDERKKIINSRFHYAILCVL